MKYYVVYCFQSNKGQGWGSCYIVTDMYTETQAGNENLINLVKKNSLDNLNEKINNVLIISVRKMKN